jgi:hypothetical protein
VIPAGCEIGRSAFQTCRSLTIVRIGRGCTTIGPFAFDCCDALASVTLPSTMRSIGQEAFADCAALATIAIPRECRVHKWAFSGSATRVTEL